MSHFTYIAAAYLLLVRDGAILLQRRYQTGFQDGQYGIPSGHLDGGETVREGCAREMREEIGITINPDNLRVVHVMHRMKPARPEDERIDFFLTADRYEGEVENREPHKCDDLRWFPLDALPENTIDYVRVAIGHYRNGVLYSEWKNTAT